MIKQLYRFRYLLTAAVIAVIVLCDLIADNFHVIRDGAVYTDLSEYITDPKDRCILSYENEHGIYLRELRFTGVFPKITKYTLKITFKNAFDHEETETIVDYFNPLVSYHSTRVRKTVTQLQLMVPKQFEGELSKAEGFDRFEWNFKRRVLLFAALCLMSIFLFEKRFRDHPEKLFLMFSLLFGVILLLSIEPVHASWDESAHFMNVYRMAGGKDYDRAAAFYQKYANTRVELYNTRMERKQLVALEDGLADNDEGKKTYPSSGLSFTNIGYLPNALFLWIGMRLPLHLPFHLLFQFGRAGGLLTYIALMYLAIRHAKRQKAFLTFIAMCPTMLYLAASYTYDAVCIEMITLGCALFFEEYLNCGKQVRLKTMILSAVLFIAGSASKAVYIPILLLLLLPFFRRKPTRRSIIFALILLTVMALIMGTFVMPVVEEMATGKLSAFGDLRGGDTGPARQLVSLVKHPVSAFRLFFTDIFRLDNFRNAGTIQMDSYLFINLMLLNIGYFGILKDKWGLLVILVLAALLTEGSSPAENQIKPETDGNCEYLTTGEKVYTAIVLFGIVFLIWLAMYLAFSEVGAGSVSGVQARYYLPLLYPMSMLFVKEPTTGKSRKSVSSLVKSLLPCIMMMVLIFTNVL